MQTEVNRKSTLKARFNNSTAETVLRRRVEEGLKAKRDESRAVASRSKASRLGLALRNARWFESSWGKKFSHEILASVWDRCPPSIVMHLGSYDRRLRWAGHEVRMSEYRNAYRVLVGRPEGKKRPLERPRRRWGNNIKMDLREVGYDGRDWINIAQARARWRAYVRAAMNLRIFLKPFFVNIGGISKEGTAFQSVPDAPWLNPTARRPGPPAFVVVVGIWRWAVRCRLEVLDDFLARIVTEDGTWLHYFGPETEADNGVASCKFTKEIDIQKYTFGRKRYAYCVFRFRRTLACGHHATRNHH
ncbi:hypothetical protein ANN_19419 [Periplaneta americana]|uniref:Uncharacterized protein n=1 Tax=Periplaneta americana TaxID=6978 RepID=A0ABQ8S9V5_PERAM|nr:hypothetical protein ANN_19419 [Periplaneta americana]